MTINGHASGLPAPPVPVDLDLRSFRWMKLDFGKLLKSEFNQTTNDLGWRCGVTLWLMGYSQVPASSLPANDASLCQLAGLGRDMKRWKKAKDVALHGYKLHSDGRLYHPICAQIVLEAALEREKMASLKKDRHKNRHSGNHVATTVETTDMPRGNHSGNH